LSTLQDAVETEEREDLWKTPLIFDLNRILLRGQQKLMIEDKLVHNVNIGRLRVDVVDFIEDQIVYL
jgi:hypothetical protein